MRVGQEFKFQGKKYAFQGYKKNGAITMQDVTTKKNLKFNLNVNESQFEILETMNQNVLEEEDLKYKKEMEVLSTISRMRKNQYFIGQGGKKFIFVKANRTRFEYRDVDGDNHYTNTFGYIKESLQEFAQNEVEEEGINMYSLKNGQVFIGNDNKKYVFVKANRTKFVMYAYNNPQMQYNAKPQFIKELLDEHIHLKNCKYCGTPNANSTKDEDLLCDSCCEDFGIHTRYSEL